jgi:hypothetical protein
MAERQLTEAEQRVIDTIYDSFRESGVFPIYQWVDKQLDAGGIDLAQTLAGMPPGLVLVPTMGGVPARPDAEICLYIRGLREARDASRDIERFLELLLYLVRREQNMRPPSPTAHTPLTVTSAEVRSDLAFDETDIAKAWWFLRTEPGLVGGGGGNPKQWSFEVTSAIRRFRQVKNLDDYLTSQSPPDARRSPAIKGSSTVSEGHQILGSDAGTGTDAATVTTRDDGEGGADDSSPGPESSTERDVAVSAAFAVSARAISDLASEVDYLGFEPLVDGLYTLLDEPRTELPLAIAVTGPWGVGKSSVMRQLRARLAKNDGRRRWLVVDFDAWKYEKSERLWAALTKAIYEQPTQEMSWWDAFKFRFRLELLRQGAWRFLPKVLLAPLMLLAGVLLLLVEALRASHISITGVVVAAGGVLTAAFTHRDLAVFLAHPFRQAIDAYTVRRRFERELGFTSEADHDVEALTKLLTENDAAALAVFVDDLDRCSTAHVVEVVEAINQIFNASRERKCVFVLGMDREVVAASIAAAYADTVHQLVGDDAETGRRFGLSYLAKIVQLTVAVPLASDAQMRGLLERMVGRADAVAAPPDEKLVRELTDELGGDGARTPAEVSAEADALRNQAATSAQSEAVDEAARRAREQALADSPLVAEAEMEVVRFLEANPRRLKQFDNAFRLQLYVANREPTAELRFDLDQLIALAKWIVLRLNWPELARKLDRDPGLLRRLEGAANNEAEADEPLEAWLANGHLVGLLREGQGSRRIADLPLAAFLHIL